MKLTNTSIRQKIILLIVFTILLCVMAIMVFTINNNNKTLKSGLENNIESLLTITAENIVAAIMFNNVEETENLISKLHAIQGFEGCLVMDSENNVFVQVNPEFWDSLSISIQNTGEPVYSNNLLVMSKELYFEEDYYGKLFIGVNTKNITIQNRKHIFQMILFSSVLLIFIFLIAYKLIGYITKPVFSLARTIETVSENLDFSIRAKKYSNDEMGVLVDGFNLMMEQIKLNQEFVSKIIDAMPSPILVVNNQKIITHMNSAACSHADITLQKIIGKSIHTYSPLISRKVAEHHAELMVNSMFTFSFEIESETKFTEYFMVSVFLIDSNENIGIRIDNISEMKTKDIQLQQAQKMESIGNLAGGLAHDFNNVLMGITGPVSILKYKIQNDYKECKNMFEKHLCTIEECSERAGDIVKQLLSLSRKHKIKNEKIDLNTVLQSVKKLCMTSFDKCISINFDLPDTPCYLDGDSSQLQQVFLNFCINASHAMTIMKPVNEPRGGNLDISIEKITTDFLFLRNQHEAEEGTYWNVSVRDSGVGINKKILSKLFDPFFTTKTVETGTGLGLSMAYNIVKKHGGFINVYSEVGIGTTFNIYLPVTSSEKTNEITYLKKEIPLYKGEGTVLIVDDEPVVAELAKDIFELMGFDTIIAENGLEGIQKYKQHKDKITFVLLDMIMPVMNGKDTYYELKIIDPTVKIIISSGFRYDSKVVEVVNEEVCGFIQKPYTIEKMSEKLTKCLNSKHKSD